MKKVILLLSMFCFIGVNATPKELNVKKDNPIDIVKSLGTEVSVDLISTSNVEIINFKITKNFKKSIMKVNEWFSSSSNYTAGVSIYASLKGHSPNLVRLFLRKESPSNFEKLKYELGKFREKTQEPSINKQEKSTVKVNLQVDNNNVYHQHKHTTQKLNSFYFYRLNELHTDLHAMSIKQRNDFQKAISLKLKLNELHPSEEGAALSLCIEIEDLFDAIETTQKVLKHYVDHKVVLNITPRNYKDLTAPQLIQSRNNKRISVSKYKKKVESFESNLGRNLSKSNTTKLVISLEKAQSKLLEHELDLQQLNDLINAPNNN